MDGGEQMSRPEELLSIEQQWRAVARACETFMPEERCLSAQELAELCQRGKRLREADAYLNHIAICRKCSEAYTLLWERARMQAKRMRKGWRIGSEWARGLALLAFILIIGGVSFLLGFYYETRIVPPALTLSSTLPAAGRLVARDVEGIALKRRLDGPLVYGQMELPTPIAQAVRQSLLSDPRPASFYPPARKLLANPNPTFWWQEVPHAQGYQVAIEGWDEVTRQWKRWFVGTTHTSHYVLPTPYALTRLADRRTYWRWCVRALPAGPIVVDWTDFALLSLAEANELERFTQQFSHSPLLLGATYEAFGRYQQAAQKYRQLLKLQPQNPYVQQALRKLAFSSKQAENSS